MLEYDRIDVSEGTDIKKKKSTGLRGCIICHYWYFVGINFRFQEKYVMVAII